jgi:MYXO-CTERM domain-containing protein
MEGLGDMLGGAFESSALGANVDGSVIVGSGFDDSGGQALLWSVGAGPRSVRALIDGAGLGLEGWRFTSATGVSADGRVIVGNGLDPSGVPSAWMITVPSPAGAGLAVAGLTLAALRRRRVR